MIIMRTRVNTATGFGGLKAIRHGLLKINDGNKKTDFQLQKKIKRSLFYTNSLALSKMSIDKPRKKLVMPHFS